MPSGSMSGMESSLYGDATGRWALLTMPLGLICPPSIVVGTPPAAVAELTCLGNPGDVVTMIYNQYAGARVAAQQVLADMFGVTQQSVSRYIAGTSRPADGDGWQTLVLIWFHPDEMARRIDERLACRAAEQERRRVAREELEQQRVGELS